MQLSTLQRTKKSALEGLCNDNFCITCKNNRRIAFPLICYSKKALYRKYKIQKNVINL